MQDGLCPEQQFEALLRCVPVERFAGALTPLVSDDIHVCFAEGPTTRAFGHVIDAVTAPITSNRPTTHGYTTMRDATKSTGLASKGIEQASNDVPVDMHVLVRKHSLLPE